MGDHDHNHNYNHNHNHQHSHTDHHQHQHHSHTDHHHHHHQHSHDHTDHHHAHDHAHDMRGGLLILAGMLAFFLLEKILRASFGSHSHSHGHAHADSDLTSSQTHSQTHSHSHDHAHSNAKESHDGCDGHDHHLTQAKSRHTATVSPQPPVLQPPTPTEPASNLGIRILHSLADASHNLTDGMMLAASFLAAEHAGNYTGAWATTAAILMHEVPHEIGDFALHIQAGSSKCSAIGVQLVTALAALLGNVLVLALGSIIRSIDSYIMPLTAGGFIYIALVDVVPDLLEEKSLKFSILQVIAMSIGVFLMYLIALFE
eukprot:TRINITY_DN9198_c0_g2_i6.p1 TRINITY_DN9198_c0_g2~~TRINITY_DN9198_c0_g2_i6.p1  ORF type:complete len:325 (-),score=70.53 TRINITY_DN9198_c0_g2_i6:82-1026(-)